MKHSSFNATISALDAEMSALDVETSALDVETSAFGAATSAIALWSIWCDDIDAQCGDVGDRAEFRAISAIAELV